MNCQKCVPTYEMRMRGLDVIAKPVYDFSTDDFAQNHWLEAFKDAIIEEDLKGTGKEEVIKKMSAWGGGSHVFVAENRNGEIHFLDPQRALENVECYFDYVKKGLTRFFRIDNLEVNEKYIKWFCKEAE